MKTIPPCSKHICLHCYHEGSKCLPLAETLSDGDAIAVQHMHDYGMQSKTPPISISVFVYYIGNVSLTK